ncbi:MAG: replicative DNA helicase [Candidatus Ancaeobacter aquaticus]|nr:replicative DNA helicase [Candidatus Ancaeobacter aquaticus]
MSSTVQDVTNIQKIMPDKLPPQNIEAEMAVLGAMLFDENTVSDIIYKLTSVSFHKSFHQKIYAAILALYEENKPVDLITLTEKLKAQGELEKAGGASYITSLLDVVSSAANVETYVQMVNEKAILRNLIMSSSEIISDCYRTDIEVNNLIDGVEKKIFDISEKRIQNDFVPIKDLIKESVMTVQNLYNKKTRIIGVPSGFADIDEKMSGLQKSDLIILAARPSMGKTSLALSIAEHVGIREKKPVALFSLEMSKEQLVMRMLCSLARVNAHKVRSGFLGESDFPDLVNAAGKLSTAPVYIDDTPSISVMELRAKARRLKMKAKIEVIIVDYIQLVAGSSRRSENRQQEMSDISQALKALARELQVPVVVLSQLNRAVESRPDHRPQLSDLRESGAIEQDADVVLLLTRREYYDREDSPGTADLIIAKQRNGPTGEIRLAFREEYTRFDDYIDREEVESFEDQ